LIRSYQLIQKTKTQNSTTIIIRETSDINTSLRLTYVLLNDKTYQLWVKAAMISLRGKKKLGYFNGTKSKPPIPAEVEEREIEDNNIMSWLLHSMEL
jgi:gag-polypeptide of LTR copia-type